MMQTDTLFTKCYKDARALFLSAAQKAGLSITSHSHPLKGLEGENLTTDVVRIGPTDACRLIVLVSGVHGVELFVGAGCQIDTIQQFQEQVLPPDTAILLVHAINPWGASHYRRNADDNVDLARNFLESGDERPQSLAYNAIHDLTASHDRAGVQTAFKKLQDELGEMGFVRALMGGQFNHPEGFSWGGDAPIWSNKTIKEILLGECYFAQQITIIEYHSGLGPYGYGMAVCMQAGAPLARTQEIFGDWVVAPRASPSETHGAIGHTTDGYSRFLLEKTLSSIVLEYGTYPPSVSLPVLLDDHWLTFHGGGDPTIASEIHARNLEVHFPDKPEWRRAICDRSRQVIRQAIAGFN